MKQKKSIVGTLLATTVLLLAACAAPAAAPAAEAPAAEAPAAEAPATGEPLKVLLFVNGVLGDKSFFDSAQRGLDKAVAELGVEGKTKPSGKPPWSTPLPTKSSTS
jgi:basic membrane protein A